MYKGIDVSKNNGKLDWDNIKNDGVQFAIIRVAYGSDIKSQDDVQAERNMSECDRLNIPYGVYLYSYALNLNEVDSEVSHVIRVVGNHKPILGVWFDMEDADGYKSKRGFDVYKNKDLLTSMCSKFCDSVISKGFNCGVYANYDYFTNCLNYETLKKYPIWLAQWSGEQPKKECILWQYSSNGVVNGSSARTDMNYYYGELDGVVQTNEDTTQQNTTKKSNEEIANEVISGIWGSGEDRKTQLNAQGYDYNGIQAIVNSILCAKVKATKKSNEEIANEVISGTWGIGEDRKNKLANAGYDYNTIQTIVNKKLEANKQQVSQVFVDVHSGDNLTKIANTNSITIQNILNLNPSIKDPNKIWVGQKIRVK